MNPSTKLIAITALSSLVLAGCGKKEEAPPAATQEDVQNAQAATEKTMESKLASSLNQTTQAIDDAKAEVETKMKAELDAKLAEQKQALTAQFNASNEALKAQVASLTKTFEAAKPQLPAPVVSSFQEKLPTLKTSVNSLESLVSSFSPTTMEQIETFKTKYEKELTTAKNVAQELSKLLANTKVGDMIPKF